MALSRFKCSMCPYLQEVGSGVCPNCGHFPTWEAVTVDEQARAEARAESGAPDSTAAEDPFAGGQGGGWTCPACDRENSPAATECIDCREPATSRGVLRISGDAGCYELAPGAQLMFGRSDDSPAASLLHSFGNVSRRHTTVVRTADGMTLLTDHSANGTWLVEPTGTRRVGDREIFTICPGTTVQLGNNPNGPNARITFETGW
jgi:hypothetical protein